MPDGRLVRMVTGTDVSSSRKSTVEAGVTRCRSGDTARLCWTCPDADRGREVADLEVDLSPGSRSAPDPPDHHPGIRHLDGPGPDRQPEPSHRHGRAPPIVCTRHRGSPDASAPPVESSDGQSGTASITYTIVKRPRPALSNLSITPHAFRASQRGATITQNPRVGARISYRDSQASQAMFTVYRRAGTRRCSSHPHTGCPRLAVAGTFRHTDKAGLNSLRFSGRIRGRALGSGDHQLNLNAKLGGQTGNTATATFRILAR